MGDCKFGSVGVRAQGLLGLGQFQVGSYRYRSLRVGLYTS